MTSLYASPLSEIVAGLLLLIGAVSASRGARRLVSGLRHARPLDVVRGIRSSVIALSAIVFAGGVLLAQTGLLVLGAVFLGEELYETALLAAIIRFGERDEHREGAASPPSTIDTVLRRIYCGRQRELESARRGQAIDQIPYRTDGHCCDQGTRHGAADLTVSTSCRR